MRVLRSRLTTVLPYFPGLQVATALSRSAPVRALPRSPEQGAGGGERNQAERTEGRTVRVAALGWLDGDRPRRGD
ncbi:MAG: hypothetical protein AVDCRST_MAG04-1067 [uncultured Acetobacteraceae bacterium]|uniref:Uncharacterized protein n=1 Tax=uncultured Acetobacteraceae bacterium TaxID=169975 RepID=A0A6J4HRC6_9PROT|nr:MAG: hypothetical protein AVDCRST_MAG04-1067 [uncultured Acetobacteraceae bacterium]